MPKVEATLSRGLQITMPSVVRKLLDLEPGDKIVFDTDTIDANGKRMVVEKAMTREEQVKTLFASLDEWREGLSDESKVLIREHAGLTANQLRERIDNSPEMKEYRRRKYGIKA